MSQRFCGSCGNPLPVPPGAFCTHCGSPVQGAATTAATTAASPARPPAAPPAYAPAYAPPAQGPVEHLGAAPVAPGGPRRPRRKWPLVVAGVAVVAVAGGAVGGVLLLRGDAGHDVSGATLPRAVTSEPEEAWSYDFSGDYLSSAVGVGDRVVLADGDGELVGLDEDGEEAWSYDDEYASYLVAAPGGDEVVFSGGEGGGVGAVSAEDGEELWWEDSGYAYAVREDGVLVSDGDEESSVAQLRWLDARTGEERWSASDVDGWTLATDAVYVLEDDQLRRLDEGSGEEDWSVDLSVGEDEYAELAATDDFVAVSVGDDVTAYAEDGGAELWSASTDDVDGSFSVGTFSADRVYLSESVYDDESETSHTTVTIRDADGEVGDVTVDDDEYFYGTGVDAGGTSWFLSWGTGELYDDQVQRVAQYDGDLTLTDRGVYARDGGDLSFYEYGEGRAAWSLDVPDDEDDSTSVYAADEGVLVAAGGEVTLYR